MVSSRLFALGISTKTPRRVIHFQDGDELEEYSTEEEGEVDQVSQIT